MSCRLGASVLASVLASFALLAVTPAHAAPKRLVVWQDGPIEQAEIGPTGLLAYNTVYLNRCPNGCPITVGQSSSINNTWGISASRTLTAFPYGDQAWNEVVACVKDVMSPFQINVVEQNPGSANHWEIMIAGRGTDLEPTRWQNVGGVAPGGCTNTAFNNALVFAFAKTYGNNTTNTCDASCVNEICATAAQEIGHVWRSMDHVREASDPMTYFSYNDRRYFQNKDAQCGSDCIDGMSPYGQTCTGNNNQSRACICRSGAQTQNSYAVLTDLFGLGPGSPPTVQITSPKVNENVPPGFSIFADVSDDSGKISKVELKIDGQIISTLERGPFVFNAPATLSMGGHRVEVVGYDPHQTPATARVDIVIGPPCQSEDDCQLETDVCVGGRCVPGSGVNGGLGTTCAQALDCLSGRCASDGTSQYCVEECLVGQCPDGFGCLDAGDGTSVCWPGYDDGSGGCGCQSSKGGPLAMMLAIIVLVLTCRRRRR